MFTGIVETVGSRYQAHQYPSKSPPSQLIPASCLRPQNPRRNRQRWERMLPHNYRLRGNSHRCPSGRQHQHRWYAPLVLRFSFISPISRRNPNFRNMPHHHRPLPTFSLHRSRSPNHVQSRHRPRNPASHHPQSPSPLFAL